MSWISRFPSPNTPCSWIYTDFYSDIYLHTISSSPTDLHEHTRLQLLPLSEELYNNYCSLADGVLIAAIFHKAFHCPHLHLWHWNLLPHSSLLLYSSVFKINMSVETLEPPDISGYIVHQKYSETPTLWCFYLGPHFRIVFITGIWLAGSFRPPLPTLTFSSCPVKGLMNLCTCTGSCRMTRCNTSI